MSNWQRALAFIPVDVALVGRNCRARPGSLKWLRLCKEFPLNPLIFTFPVFCCYLCLHCSRQKYPVIPVRKSIWLPPMMQWPVISLGHCCMMKEEPDSPFVWASKLGIMLTLMETRAAGRSMGGGNINKFQAKDPFPLVDIFSKVPKIFYIYFWFATWQL